MARGGDAVGAAIRLLIRGCSAGVGKHDCDPTSSAALFSPIRSHPVRRSCNPFPTFGCFPPRRVSPRVATTPPITIVDSPAVSFVVSTSSLTPSVFSSGGGRYWSPSSDFHRRGSRDTCVRKFRFRCRIHRNRLLH